MTRSRKYTCFFSIGIACIASAYALAIHWWLKGAPYSASLSAILGALVLSFVTWRRLYERRGEKYVSGVLLGGLCGCFILILGPLGFGIESLLLGSSKGNVLSELVYIPLISIASFPLIFLAMHGWAVVLGSVFLGGILESVERGKPNKEGDEDTEEETDDDEKLIVRSS